MRLMILNGPNLNLLGVREPHIYGIITLASIKASCEEFASFADAQLSFHQSNHEGELVDLIQSAREEADAIIINPAGCSFTSRDPQLGQSGRGPGNVLGSLPAGCSTACMATILPYGPRPATFLDHTPKFPESAQDRIADYCSAKSIGSRRQPVT